MHCVFNHMHYAFIIVYFMFISRYVHVFIFLHFEQLLEEEGNVIMNDAKHKIARVQKACHKGQGFFRLFFMFFAHSWEAEDIWESYNPKEWCTFAYIIYTKKLIKINRSIFISVIWDMCFFGDWFGEKINKK